MIKKIHNLSIKIIFYIKIPKIHYLLRIIWKYLIHNEKYKNIKIKLQQKSMIFYYELIFKEKMKRKGNE